MNRDPAIVAMETAWNNRASSMIPEYSKPHNVVARVRVGSDTIRVVADRSGRILGEAPPNTRGEPNPYKDHVDHRRDSSRSDSDWIAHNIRAANESACLSAGVNPGAVIGSAWNILRRASSRGRFKLGRKASSQSHLWTSSERRLWDSVEWLVNEGILGILLAKQSGEYDDLVSQRMEGSTTINRNGIRTYAPMTNDEARASVDYWFARKAMSSAWSEYSRKLTKRQQILMTSGRWESYSRSEVDSIKHRIESLTITEHQADVLRRMLWGNRTTTDPDVSSVTQNIRKRNGIKLSSLGGKLVRFRNNRNRKTRK